jgi:hypothetical protein
MTFLTIERFFLQNYFKTYQEGAVKRGRVKRHKKGGIRISPFLIFSSSTEIQGSATTEFNGDVAPRTTPF